MWAQEFLDGSLPVELQTLVYPFLTARLQTIETLGHSTDSQVAHRLAVVTALLSRDADYIQHFGGAAVVPLYASGPQTREQAISGLESSGRALVHALLQAWSLQQSPTDIITQHATSYEALAYTLMEDESLLRQEWLVE